MVIVRHTTVQDVPALQGVAEATGLFPGEMLPGMMRGFLEDPPDGSLWLTAEVNSQATGFCFAAPEVLTEATWNMKAIAVHASRQGEGIGSAIVRFLEEELQARGCRILIADTSGKDEFASTREFYARNGYIEEARIRNFWAAGDDKIIFWKSLT